VSEDSGAVRCRTYLMHGFDLALDLGVPPSRVGRWRQEKGWQDASPNPDHPVTGPGVWLWIGLRVEDVTSVPVALGHTLLGTRSWGGKPRACCLTVQPLKPLCSQASPCAGCPGLVIPGSVWHTSSSGTWIVCPQTPATTEDLG